MIVTQLTTTYGINGQAMEIRFNSSKNYGLFSICDNIHAMNWDYFYIEDGTILTIKIIPWTKGGRFPEPDLDK